MAAAAASHRPREHRDGDGWMGQAAPPGRLTPLPVSQAAVRAVTFDK